MFSLKALWEFNIFTLCFYSKSPVSATLYIFFDFSLFIYNVFFFCLRDGIINVCMTEKCFSKIFLGHSAEVPGAGLNCLATFKGPIKCRQCVKMLLRSNMDGIGPFKARLSL